MALYECLQNREWDLARTLLDEADDTLITIHTRDIWLELLDCNNISGNGVGAWYYACSCPDIPIDLLQTIYELTKRTNCKSYDEYDDEYDAYNSKNGMTDRKDHHHHPCFMYDNRGYTAVHYAAATGSYKTLAFLLRHIPTKYANTIIKNQYKQPINNTTIVTNLESPTYLMWYKYLHKQYKGESNQILKQRIKSLVQTKDYRDLQDGPAKNLWNKTMLTLNNNESSSSLKGSASARSGPIIKNAVHAMVLASDYIPSIAFWWALHITDDYDLLDEIDTDRNLLLHIACTKKNDNNYYKIQIQSKVRMYIQKHADPIWYKYCNTYIIKQLCFWEPSAANKVNIYGQLPIHIAIDYIQSYTILHILLKANPYSRECTDPITGLPPLLQAATKNQYDLTTIFHLVRYHADLFQQE